MSERYGRIVSLPRNFMYMDTETLSAWGRWGRRQAGEWPFDIHHWFALAAAICGQDDAQKLFALMDREKAWDDFEKAEMRMNRHAVLPVTRHADGGPDRVMVVDPAFIANFRESIAKAVEVWEVMEACVKRLAKDWVFAAQQVRQSLLSHACCFGPILIDQRWLSVDVVDLAKAIVHDGAYERLPILSDALMDAGCDSELLITHFRSPRHVCRWADELAWAKNPCNVMPKEFTLTISG